jgi:hypothetical protein
MVRDMNEELNQIEEMEDGVNQEQEYVDSSEEIMGQIAVQEELKRIDIQESPTSKVGKETKNSTLYKESMEMIETIGDAFQKLLGFGIDYNNALAIASNLMTNDANMKQAHIQQTIVEQNQP